MSTRRPSGWRFPALVAMSALSALSALPACGSSSTKPPVTTPLQATPAPAADDAAPVSMLVLSLTDAERASLRAAMSHSIVAVAFDGRGLRFLPNCKLEGSGYTWMDIEYAKAPLSLDSAAEVRLTAPPGPSGKTLAAPYWTTLLLTGRLTSTRNVLPRADLQGACDGATHFIHHADAGLPAGPDGAMPTCPAEMSDDSHECASPLRLHLYPFDAAPSWDIVRSMPPFLCPSGAFIVGQKCAESRPDGPYQCGPGEEEECSASCKRGDAGSCNTLGWMIARGPNGAHEMEKAIELFQAACEKKHARACGNAAFAMREARGTNEFKKVLELYVQACTLGDEESCLYAGQTFAQDPESLGVAADLFIRACHGGSTEACGLRATMMEGNPEEIGYARQYHRRACEEGYLPSCVRLGGMFARAEGGAQDFTQARKLFELACTAEAADGCAHLGLMYQAAEGVPQNFTKAAELFEKACGGNAALGCRMLASMYEHSLGRKRDMTRAAGFYAKGCSIGENESCLELGRMHLAGDGILKDEQRAAELFKNACDAGVMAGCHNLALLSEEGTGVPKDPARAKELHEKACKAGFGRSCRRIGLDKP